MKLKYIAFLVIVIFSGSLFSSCSRGYGCGLEEKYNNPDLESSKRGKSTLFGKSQKKRKS
ncbi:MAG: hypothetical protein WAT22_09905 [Saprospiraceae bacterium]|jgi:hypothetical protein|nr:hypothetical protein [Saprospiraceae bacterium]MBP6447631.1 hypothetical protein [Saprospiraceae bacterium]